MPDNYDEALRAELLKAMIANPQSAAQQGVGTVVNPGIPSHSGRNPLANPERTVTGGMHGSIKPEQIRNPARPPALPMDPAVQARLKALVDGRARAQASPPGAAVGQLERGSRMNLPNELEAASEPEKLQALLAGLAPADRIRLLQQLQSASRAKPRAALPDFDRLRR